MGNYDRDYHLRMHMQPAPRAAMAPAHHHHPHAHNSFPQQQQQQQFQAHAYRPYATQMPQDHARNKGPTAPSHATTAGMNAPYFHQLLDPDRRGNNVPQAAMYVSSGMTGGGYGPTTGAENSSVKRVRGNSVSSSSNSSYLPTLDALPYGSGNGGNSSTSGYQSPPGGPAFDPDHPLPDFSPDWFVGRISPPHHGSTGTAPTSGSIPLPHPSPTSLFGGVSSSHVHINAPSVSAPMDDGSSGGGASSNNNSRLGGLSGLPSPNGMFNVDALLPDYESSLYSLWNSSTTGSGGLGYDNDNDNDQGHQQNPSHPQQSTQAHHPQAQKPASPHMYISPEDELKMDYPGLSEFNQGELDYLYDPMESGGPSPTTPLGTTGGSNMSKLDNYSSSAPRGNGNIVREPYVERPVGSSDYLKRDNSASNEDAARLTKKARAAYGGSFDNGRGSSGGNGFRSMARNATIEAKRPLGSSSTTAQGHQSGSSVAANAPHAAQQQHPAPHPQQTGAGAPAPTSSSAPATTPTSSGEGGSTSKRPRSRQCDFPGCTNRARSHQKCKKHGGAHQCVFDGCTKNSQSRGLCIAHGGGSRCKVEGCVRAAQSKGLCKSHGGGEFCAVEGCRKKAHLKHLCRTHGGGVRCKFAKCSKWAQRKGWCMAHAKEFIGS